MKSNMFLDTRTLYEKYIAITSSQYFVYKPAYYAGLYLYQAINKGLLL